MGMALHIIYPHVKYYRYKNILSSGHLPNDLVHEEHEIRILKSIMYSYILST